MFNLIVRFAFGVLLVNALLAPMASAQSSKLPPTATTSSKLSKAAQQVLAKALFYYNNDDISDEAARQCQLVLKQYSSTPEAETAQFYLGSYYQRKYYILKERYA